MKRIAILFILFSLIIGNSTFTLQENKKIVALVAGRNEEIMIAQYLKAMSNIADAIVFLDDASTDTTLKIVQSLQDECSVEKIIEKTVWYRDEPGDRNLLLQAGRDIGGTHFITLDVDEMFTANCLDDDMLRQRIHALQPGDRLWLTWIQLWRSVDQYRYDDSNWTRHSYKDFAFCDNGTCSYESDFINTTRTPNKYLYGQQYYVPEYTWGVLHFQFVNWRNLLIKQAWYRCIEHIRHPERFIQEINDLYAPAKDETNLATRPCPSYWFAGYDFLDTTIFARPERWREEQILGWFCQYGTEYFKHLDIWDIDWGNGLSKKRTGKRNVADSISKEYIRQFLPENPVIVEAGAHAGHDTQQMSQLFPDAHIFAFEPVPHLFFELQHNTKNCTNVTCFPLALDTHKRLATFYISSGDSDGSSSLLEPKEHLSFHPHVYFNNTIVVPTISLDEWARDYNIDHVDFLWFDLQGNEYAVLKASPNMLKTITAIYTEVSLKQMYNDAPLYHEFRSWLEQQGFMVAKEELPWEDMGNVLFVKRPHQID